MKTIRNTQESEQTHRRGTVAARGIGKLVVLGIINLLVLTSVWAAPAPNAPSNLKAVPVSSSQINLTWTDNASSETAYYLEQSIGNSTSFSVVATLAANSTAYSKTGLSPSTTYYYRVRAYDGSNAGKYSSYSNVAGATTPSTYTITTSSSPTVGGSTSGGGTKTSGTVATVTATANAGYVFSKWTENGVQISTSASYSFTVTSNRSLVANFTSTTTSYTITTGSSPTTGGSTSGGGTKTSGTIATVSATVSSGYAFSSWTENGSVVSSLASYSFTVTGNRTLMANFNAVTTTYTITTSSSPTAGGSTSGGGTKTSGSTATVSAVANSGYVFSSWTDGGTVVSTSSSYSFTVTGNRLLVANFSAVTTSYTITTSSSPTAGGSTSGGGTKTSGTSATVSAIPNGGYAFVNWTENGSIVSTSSSYSFMVTGNRSLVANFTTSTSYTITTSSSPTAGGSTSGGGTKTSGSAVTVTATANAGYNLSNWTENGVVVSTAASYSFTAIGNRTLVANFAALLATPGQCQWTWDFGGSGVMGADSAYSKAVVADKANNVIVVGMFQGTVDFGTGAMSAASGGDMFVGKYSPSGVVTWVKRFGSTGATTPFGVAVDANNNVIVVGSISGTVDFGTGALTSQGSGDIFVAKFSATGVCTWAKAFGGTGDDAATSVAVDGNGDVYVAGYYGNSGFAANFGGGAVSSSGNRDIFLAKYSGATGAYVWVRTVGGTGADMATGVAIDNAGNPVVSGYFQATVNFGNGSVTSAGGYDGFIARYSGATGGYLWSRIIGSASNDWGYGLAVDGSGNTFVTGFFTGSIDFGAGAVAASNVGSIYLAKYSTTGALVWLKTVGMDNASPPVIVKGVAVDPSGNAIITGYMNAELDFGGGFLFNIAGTGTYDVFVVKYSAAGTYVWGKRAGGTADDHGMAVATDGSGNVLATGDFPTAIDFGCGIHTSLDGQDGYLAKFAP